MRLLLGALFFAWTGGMAMAGETNKVEWLRHEADQDTVIVFVHDFRGSKKTWAYIDNDEVSLWPQIVKDDPAFQGANIAIYLYETDLAAPDAAIEVMAKSAQGLLNEIKQYKNILFVAHGIGGVVVKTLLLGNQELVIKSRIHLHLFGVPTNGLQVEGLYGLYYGTNPLPPDQRVRLPADTLFTFHNLFWDSVKPYITVYCYWEGKKPSVDYLNKQYKHDRTIVSPNTSSSYCNNTETIADKDHITMVQPKNMADQTHQLFSTHYTNGKNALAKRDPLLALPGVVYLDSFPRAERKILYRITSDEYSYIDSGIPVPPGKYLAVADFKGVKQYQMFEVSASEAAKRSFYLAAEGKKERGRLCIFGVSGARVTVEKDSRTIDEFPLETGSEFRCTFSKAYPSGKYTVAVAKRGYHSDSEEVSLGTDVRLVRFPPHPKQ